MKLQSPVITVTALALVSIIVGCNTPMPPQPQPIPDSSTPPEVEVPTKPTPTPTKPMSPVITEEPTSPAPPEPSIPDTSTPPVTYDIPPGTADPDLTVDVYVPEKVWPGTTLLADLHVADRPRIIEVNLHGEIVWEYLVPTELARYTNPGFDVEWLPNDNVLFVLPRNGVYEINRDGNVIWSYLQPKVSHDADRLPNGNTLMAWGGVDTKKDAQVREVNPSGETVWSWRFGDHFDQPPYSDISDEGWTHTNAVSRLENGNTLISPRNFNILVEVDTEGNVVRTIGEGTLKGQHDPEVQPNGNILLANHGRPHLAIEYDPDSGSVVWQSKGFPVESIPVRDADRLPNGNILITASTRIVEITPDGELVWRLLLGNIDFQTKMDSSGLGFYKAERING